MYVAALALLAFVLCGHAIAQTLTYCQIGAAQRCFFEQEGKSNRERGDQTMSDYCTKVALEECGDG